MWTVRLSLYVVPCTAKPEEVSALKVSYNLLRCHGLQALRQTSGAPTTHGGAAADKMEGRAVAAPLGLVDSGSGNVQRLLKKDNARLQVSSHARECFLTKRRLCANSFRGDGVKVRRVWLCHKTDTSASSPLAPR